MYAILIVYKPSLNLKPMLPSGNLYSFLCMPSCLIFLCFPKAIFEGKVVQQHKMFHIASKQD